MKDDKRFARVFPALIIVLPLLLAACGGRDTSAATETSAATGTGSSPDAGPHAGHGTTSAPEHAAMDHSTMTGMDHSKTTGMNHSTMTGMDHSTMTGMDHSKMGHATSSTATGHTGMDHSGMDHSGSPAGSTGHSNMSHTKASGTTATGASAKHGSAGHAGEEHSSASHAGMDHTKGAATEAGHAGHGAPVAADVSPAAGVDHSRMHHGAAGTAAGSLSGGGVRPVSAGGLAPDAFDAPAATSVRESAKAIEGRGDEVQRRGITPGEDRENPPTPAPATRDVNGSLPATGSGADAAAGSTATLYVCPMHPEVTSDQPGTCPKCGMDLVKKD